MGGVLIVGSVLISTLLWARLSSVYVWTAMIATLAFAAIGFVDDYSKMAKQRSLGLTGRQKLLAQLLVAVCVWAVLFTSVKFLGGTGYSWNISIPFFKATADPYGKSFIGPYLYMILIAMVLLGSSNAVNLTDGLDGLAISITFIAMSALTGFTYLSSDARWAEISRFDAPAGSGGVDHLLWSDGGRESRLSLVQRAACTGFHGRRRQPRDRRGNGNGGGADEAGVYVVDGGWGFCD